MNVEKHLLRLCLLVRNDWMSIKNVVQGEYSVSSLVEDQLTTVLGSCIAACIYDIKAGIGGMNHFLLPGGSGGTEGNVKYGAFLMEVLVNELLKAGANRNMMKARLYGGGKMNAALGDVGARNIAFARKYLGNESIPLEFEDVGGTLARRITMLPTIGKVDVRLIQGEAETVNEEIKSHHKSSSEIMFF